MAQDTLNEILEVEKQIKEMLDAETEKARRWLEQAKRKIEQERQSEIAQRDESVAQRKAAAKKAAEDKAAAIVQRARSLADHIARLDDNRLQQFVWEHIADIAPRVTRDR